MNCQKFEEVVSELARGQMMDADLQTEALDHVAECRQCMLRLSHEENLSRGFATVKREMATLEAPGAVEARLLAAFQTPSVAQPGFTRRNNSRYWLTAVAALLLIVLGVMAMRARTENNQPKQLQAADKQEKKANDTTAVANATPKIAAPKNVAPEKRVQPGRKPANFLAKANRNRSTRNQNVVANHAVNEVATEFMPLGYMTAANFQEGGQIVRVELPRATLANFGFPVNMDRYREKVKADILLGADGLAHAIRFVQ